MIDTNEKLAEFLPVVQSAAWVAIDTEADSLHSYPEKVCLIQIGTADGDYIVDPLARMDLNPLLAVLARRELIFHAADYDLRLLRKHHEFTASAIFDTMLAARLLGERYFGLGALVEKYLGVKLDKGPQKADWARRPLPQRMLDYARNDTHHLKQLEETLRAALRERGRLAWHEESCARLISDCAVPIVVDPDECWRLKGSILLDRFALAILRELWHWREREALAAHRPPFFVMAHDRLVDIAVLAAQRKPFDHLIYPKMHPRRRANLLQTVHAAQALPEKDFPEPIQHRSRRPTAAEFRRYHELIATRDRNARALQLDPTLIAPKSMLGDLARDWDKHAPTLMHWQRQLLVD